MILDAQDQFSDQQALTATAVGTNVRDLGVDSSIGVGEPMAVLFTVDVAADQTTGDEDYTFQVEYATNAAQTTGRQLAGELNFESGTPAAPALDADLLVAGFQFSIGLGPVPTSMSARYLGIRYVLAGTTPTITMTAFLVPMQNIDVSRVYYADGFTIS